MDAQSYSSTLLTLRCSQLAAVRLVGSIYSSSSSSHHPLSTLTARSSSGDKLSNSNLSADTQSSRYPVIRLPLNHSAPLTEGLLP